MKEISTTTEEYVIDRIMERLKEFTKPKEEITVSISFTVREWTMICLKSGNKEIENLLYFAKKAWKMNDKFTIGAKIEEWLELFEQLGG